MPIRARHDRTPIGFCVRSQLVDKAAHTTTLDDGIVRLVERTCSPVLSPSDLPTIGHPWWVADTDAAKSGPASVC